MFVETRETRSSGDLSSYAMISFFLTIVTVAMDASQQVYMETDWYVCALVLLSGISTGLVVAHTLYGLSSSKPLNGYC